MKAQWTRVTVETIETEVSPERYHEILLKGFGYIDGAIKDANDLEAVPVTAERRYYVAIDGEQQQLFETGGVMLPEHKLGMRT
jgi:hypothetical protein